MSAPLGSRICPNLGCGRRIHISASGTVYARCLAHTLQLLSGVFAAPGWDDERVCPPVPRSSSLPASSVRRPAA
jgi:hypothetical protein